MRKFTIIALALTFSLNIFSQNNAVPGLESINIQSAEATLEFLASDWTEGREMGTKGAYLAADYMASVFKLYNIKPLGDMATTNVDRERRMKGVKPEEYRSYFQNFDLLTGPRDSHKEMYITSATGYSSITRKLVEGSDYEISQNPLPVEIDAPVAFAGYGISDMDSENNLYKNSNVQGKVVLIITGYPGINDPSSRYRKIASNDPSFNNGRFERDKLSKAIENGALAVLRYNPGSEISSKKPANLPFFYNNEFYEGDKEHINFYQKSLFLPGNERGSEIPVIDINKRAAESLLAGMKYDLDVLLDSGFELSEFNVSDLNGKRVKFKAEKELEVIKARNVIGYLEGEDSKKAVVIGGHYDHVGKYGGFIYNGADDNASGTAGMMTLAKAFAESGKKPPVSIIFAAWTGEEQGLWGSKYFVNNIPDDIEIVLNLNMDMISRTTVNDEKGNYLSFKYTTGYEEFEDIFSKINRKAKLNLDMEIVSQEQPRGGSDFASFAAKGIPVISLFTGLHRDYHMPNDEIELVDIDKMVRILKLAYLGLNDILEENLLLED